MRLALALAAVLAVAAPARAEPLTVASAKSLSPRLTEYQLATPAFDFPATVRVLVPGGYAQHPRRRYPVLYLLHGSFDTAASWTTKGDAEKLTAPYPLIVVMPRTAGKGNAGGWASDWDNEGRGGVPRFETFTIRQLIPWIDRRYRTRARRSGRAIAGLSMGGFSAMSYAARHPDLFAAAASFSGAVDTNNPEVQPVIEGETLADGGATPDAIWGPRLTDEIVWRTHNPWDLAANLTDMTLSIRTGNGQPGPGDSTPFDPIEAGVHDMSVSLHDRLDALHLAHVFDAYGNGTHSWPYWQRDLKLELPRIMATFAHPQRVGAVTYTTAEPRYGVYGWDVVTDRPGYAWTTLRGATRAGFALDGTGTATVSTPRLYRPRSKHVVTIGGRAEVHRADGRGRLAMVVALPARVAISP